LAEKPQNAKQEVKIMRRKKLLRQVAAAAVALSMAVSLSAPAFAATFDLSNGGLVITANDKGITVEQDDGTSSTIGKDEEIEIIGSYSSANGAMQTAEENRQEENQPVTPAKEKTSEETQEAEDTPAAEKKQEQKDTEAPADPEQNTETENKDNNSDPADEEKKEQNAPAKGELNASAGEGQESKAEDEGQPKPEAKASAVASTSASDDASNDASNGHRKAPARSSGEGERSSEGERRGIIQIFANTLVKLKLKDATIDQPHAADTATRGMAAIDIQGSGNVEIKVEGNNTLNGSGNSAGIQKNDDVSTGKLTITAKDKDQTLNVNADVRGAAIGGSGWGWNEGSNSQHGTQNIEINGGTVNTQGRIGSGYKGGAAENIVITGDAVVNANGGIGGGSDEGYEGNEGRQTSITISGNAQVNATYKMDTGNDYGHKYGFWSDDAGIAVIGGGVGSSSKKSHAKVTIEGNAQVTAENRAYGGSAGIGGGANGTGEVIIGGKAQVKATGSAEHHGSYNSYGAGAAIGDGGTAGERGSTVQNGKNQFTIANDIEDNAEIKMTNKGNDSSNTVTQTRRNGEWVTSGEQTPEECDHSNPFVEITVAPTCTESGYTVSKCTRCGKETGEHTNIVAPLGHEYKNGVCTRCGAPEPQENGSAAPAYTVTGAETYETSVVDGRYIIAVPSEDAALNAVLGDLRAIKAQGADVVVFRTRSRESSLVIDEMLAMGTDVTPFVLTHNGSEAQLTINGAAHNELIH
jgi:outer membrane biosynthesis protein TonB/DNA-directed RNA polymerase subunit RPC12/RpoP